MKTIKINFFLLFLVLVQSLNFAFAEELDSSSPAETIKDIDNVLSSANKTIKRAKDVEKSIKNKNEKELAQSGLILEAVPKEELPPVFKEQIETNVYLDEISGFTTDELKSLAFTYKPEGELKKKLQEHLSMVFVVNRKFNTELNRPYIRIAEWNVERGFHIDEIKEIFLNSESYKNTYTKNIAQRHKKDFEIELKDFKESDVLCLHEVDIGMPRTKYKNIAKDFSDSLGWNYAYSTEFVEVGPLFTMSMIEEDKYKGLHGSVIVSKFPIVSTKKIVLPQCYDWYKEETKKHTSPVEYLRRGLAVSLFDEKIMKREVRHGDRHAIVADIKLPNDEIITVASTHFEDRAFPDCRLKQFKFLLEELKNKTTPVVLAGDFNTSTTDTKPTSVNKEVFKRVRDPDFLARAAATVAVPGLPILSGLAAITASKLIQYKDPSYPHIPVVFPNHERKFFLYMKEFQFADGSKFDISGDKDRSSNGKAGLLANSNERHWKGFKSTYRLEEPRIIAYFKLDWFFVKPLGERYRPFNGRTLKTLSKSVKGGLSDHNPITVDIEIEDGAAEKFVQAMKSEKRNEDVD